MIFVIFNEISAPVDRFLMSSCLRFEGCLLHTACFSSFHRCWVGFKSGLIYGPFIIQCFVCLVLSHSWVFLTVFWAIILLEAPAATETKLSNTGHHVLLQNIIKPPWSLTVGTTFFSLCALILYLWTENWKTKNLQLCLFCPKDFLPEAPWLVNVHFGKFQSNFFFDEKVRLVVFHYVHFCSVIVRSGTDVPLPWSSPLISLDVVLACIICLFSLS